MFGNQLKYNIQRIFFLEIIKQPFTVRSNSEEKFIFNNKILTFPNSNN